MCVQLEMWQRGLENVLRHLWAKCSLKVYATEVSCVRCLFRLGANGYKEVW